jgi:hypothetical protein
MNQTIDPVIQRLIEHLGDKDPRTRRNAAGALRLNGHRAVCAIPDLMRVLAEDKDCHVRQEAEQAIRCLKAVA